MKNSLCPCIERSGAYCFTILTNKVRNEERNGINGINDSLANPGRAPILRTKSVTKKEMNKCMAEIYDPGRIRTRAARLNSQYHNHRAKENSP